METTINLPDGLHPDSANLIVNFAQALAEKLYGAQQKYGLSNDWTRGDWVDRCRIELIDHVDKGDPLDVAAYCAFLWHHSEPTSRTQCLQLGKHGEKLLHASKKHSDDAPVAVAKGVVAEIAGIPVQDVTSENVLDLLLPAILRSIMLAPNPVSEFREFLRRVRTGNVMFEQEKWDWQGATDRLIECGMSKLALSPKAMHWRYLRGPEARDVLYSREPPGTDPHAVVVCGTEE